MIYNLIPLQLIPGIAGGKSDGAAKGAEAVSADMAQLKSMSLEDLINRLAESAVNFAINLAIAIVVFYVGRFIIRKIYRLVGSIFVKRKIDRSLSTFVLSLINIVLYFILLVTVIGILGIETTSFLALFASAGVAIGMALSGTLQNFAGGVLILLLKPYKIGDYIEVQGYAGKVKEIQLFFTIITTSDNKYIAIPNGGLSTGSVNNWTREEYRRVSWTVSISYGDDVDVARQAILRMFEDDARVMPGTPESPGDMNVAGDGSANDGGVAPVDDTDTETVDQHRTFWDRVLHRHRHVKKVLSKREERWQEQMAALLPTPDYTPSVVVAELGASSVDLQVKAWTLTKDYWDVFFHYNEKFYKELPSQGIRFPFPQLDVHLPVNHTVINNG